MSAQLLSYVCLSRHKAEVTDLETVFSLTFPKKCARICVCVCETWGGKIKNVCLSVLTSRSVTCSLSVCHLHARGFTPGVSPRAGELSGLRPLLNIYRGFSGRAGKSNIHFQSAKCTHWAPLIFLFLNFYLWHESEYRHGYVCELSSDLHVPDALLVCIWS